MADYHVERWDNFQFGSDKQDGGAIDKFDSICSLTKLTTYSLHFPHQFVKHEER